MATQAEPLDSTPLPVAQPKQEPVARPPAVASSPDADPQTLGQYRIAIIAAAKRYKRYPRLALDNNWEGQAEIRMVIGTDGAIASISIKTPSGHDVLDQQALEMIRKAKPQAPIPAALRGRGFTVDVPVLFSLKEETG
jgi:periplasmic protein TonB